MHATFTYESSNVTEQQAFASFEAHFSAMLHDLWDREEVAMKFRDKQYIVEHNFGPFCVGRHTDVDLSSADSRDGAVVTKDGLRRSAEGSEGSEPVTVGAHGV